jgi:hypothetical protein
MKRGICRGCGERGRELYEIHTPGCVPVGLWHLRCFVEEVEASTRSWAKPKIDAVGIKDSLSPETLEVNP